MTDSTDLTTKSNTDVAAGGAFNPFSTAGAGAGSSLFVKFTGTTGNFTYGQNDEEIAHGTDLAANILNSEWHWAFWWQGEVLETRVSRIWDDPMGWQSYPGDLPESYTGDMTLAEIRAEQSDRKTNFMDGWGVQGVVNMRAIGSEAEYTFKLNAGVAMNAFRALLQNYGRWFQTKEGLTPVVEINAEKYKSKVPGVGWRWAPRFKITEWMSEADLAAAAGDGADDYTAPAEESEEETPKPRRGRRGRGEV